MVSEPGGGPVDTAHAPPTFTIMCSAYRCEAYLADTIASVVGQTFTDWELVVVDNGISDAIADIVRQHSADRRVRLIRQENARLIGGITTAAKAARGRYLVPLDSDDMLMPDFCQRMATILDGRSEIDVLSCDAHLFDDGGAGTLARSFLRRTTGLEHRLTLARPDRRARCGSVLRRVPPGGLVRRRWLRPRTDLVEDIALFLRLGRGRL